MCSPLVPCNFQSIFSGHDNCVAYSKHGADIAKYTKSYLADVDDFLPFDLSSCLSLSACLAVCIHFFIVLHGSIRVSTKRESAKLGVQVCMFRPLIRMSDTFARAYHVIV